MQDIVLKFDLKPKRCEHCGSIILETDGFNLGLNHRKIYEFIRKNQPCYAKDIANHIYANRRDGGPQAGFSMITQYISAINKELKRIDLQIISIRGRGYEILSTKRVI